MKFVGGLFGRVQFVLSLLLWPMTPTKLIKLALLAFIFAANFSAWGNVIGGFLGSIIPVIGGLLGNILAIVAFSMCQYSEIEPDLISLGCEEPEANLKKVKLAGRSPMHAGLLCQDVQDELVNTSPVEIARARLPQSFAFWLDLAISGTAWYPFSAGAMSLLIAPMGLLDFNLFNAFMLLVTVFGTPRIWVSAMKDGRIKAAKVGV